MGSPSPTAIYTAAAVHTLDPSRPTAEAVAVRDGRFLAVGTVDDLLRIDGATVDGSLERSVLLPGFVEAHSHTMAGGMWLHTYCGRFDRRGPDGHVWPGCTDLAAVIQRLREAEADLSAAGAGPDEPLLAWGLDPIYYPGERLVARHLDLVSTTRPIFVMHASCHLATVNTALMELDGIGPDTDMEGLPKDGSGWPIGELQEPAAMVLADSAFRKFWGRMRAEESLWNFGRKARNTGTTTLTDLGNRSSTDPAEIERFRKAVDHDDFPARLSVFHMPTPGTPEALEEAAAAVVATRAESSDKLRFGHVKLVVDGSIQGFTARLRWPGYLQEGNGIWVVPPEQVADILRPYHRAGLLIHVHCNGDEAVDVYLEAVEDARRRVEADTGLVLRWIFDIPGESGLEAADVTLDVALNHAPDALVGFGLGGPEIGVPRPQFAEHFAAARAAGLHSVPHAGESTGPQTIRDAIEHLGAERIGHGIAAAQDPALMALLAERGIVLEVCPTSNVSLGVYATLEEVPVRTLVEAGVDVALGADDPLLFGSRLAGQYNVLRAAQDFSDDELATLAAMSVRRSHAPDDLKAEALTGIERWRTS